jgi:cyclopropane-fatty-acyl-phospholipid synthase
MRWAERAFLAAISSVTGGSVLVRTPERTERFGTASDLDTTLVVHDRRFFRRALEGDDIGIGESFMDGDWTSPDLVALARLMIRNRRILEDRRTPVAAVRRFAAALARRLRDNSIDGSRRHIRQHYDLGNDFFRLFLDESLQMYSSAYFETASDSLEQAQINKVDRICRMLVLRPEDHVLEIGSGWGGFARWAASRYGCRVTTTTISEQQYRSVCDWKRSAGAVGERVEVLRTDYRALEGQFDKVVSLEMFEAVGLGHYDDYFGVVDRLLTPDGTMLLQTITMDEQWFPHYHGSPDWIEKYIFPGGELASVGEILASLARRTTLSVYAAEHFGSHYARTLREWRRRFHAQLDAVRTLGFDERFIRMWDFYLAICEATFLERHTGVVQLMLAKNGTRQTLFNEPWSSDAARFGLADIADRARHPNRESA